MTKMSRKITLNWQTIAKVFIFFTISLKIVECQIDWAEDDDDPGKFYFYMYTNVIFMFLIHF